MKPRTAVALLCITAVVLLTSCLRPKPHTIVLVRHAERADQSKDTLLSPAGEDRAVRLAEALSGLGIKSIYVTEYKRTQQTAQPLAQRLGLAPVVHTAKDSAGLVQALRRGSADDTVLVVGHSDTLPELIKQLGVREPIELPATEFHHLYIVVTHPSGAPTLLRLHYGASL
jgi:broad specificity phosphatase PhoE